MVSALRCISSRSPFHLLLAVLGVAILTCTTLPAQAQEQEQTSILAGMDNLPIDGETRRLVEKAARLMQKRAEGEISFGEYRKRLHFFEKNHPDFYGAFFGDPYHYDARNSNISWVRDLIEYELNPLFPNGRLAFQCDPHAYDPFFSQFPLTSACRGPLFAQSAFAGFPPVWRGPEIHTIDRMKPLPLAFVKEHLVDDEGVIRLPHSAPERPAMAAVAGSSEPRSLNSQRESRREEHEIRSGDEVVDIPSRASRVRPAPELSGRAARAARHARARRHAEMRERIRAARERMEGLRESSRSGNGRVEPAERSARNSAYRSSSRGSRTARGSRADRSSRTERSPRSRRSDRDGARRSNPRRGGDDDRGSR